MKQVGKKVSLIVKTLAFTVLVPGTVAVVIPSIIVKINVSYAMVQPFFPRILGLLATLAGLSICLWCFWVFINKGKGTPSPFDPPKKLVIVGLYRYVRNPMYIGIILIVLGEVILYSSLLLMLYLGMLLVIFHIGVVYYEEPRLKAEFGETYDKYLISVPRWPVMFKQKTDILAGKPPD